MQNKLNKEFKYIHINILDKDTTQIKYDSISTLYSMALIDKTSGLYHLFNTVLEKEYMPVEDMLISDYDPEIIWMDYRENYLIDRMPSIDPNDDIDDNDEEESFPKIFGIGAFNQNELVNITPWGKFTENDPMNPMNLYEDIQVLHLKGFDFSYFRGLENVMNSIDGVAKWSIIDRYSAIICVARHYNLTDVKKNVEETIYETLNYKKFNKFTSVAADAQHISDNMEEDNFIVVFPDKTTKVIKNPSEDDVKDVNKLYEDMPDCIIFKNGELYECE